MMTKIRLQCTPFVRLLGINDMSIKCFWLCVLASLITLTAGCASTSDPADAYKGETGEQIFAKGEKAMRDRSYREAIKRFEALDVQYPLGRENEIAQLQIIYAYYMTDEYALAEAGADRFIHAHPTNPHVDYAYYMRGLSNYYQNLGVFERILIII